MKWLLFFALLGVNLPTEAQLSDAENSNIWKIQRPGSEHETFIFFTGPVCTNDIKIGKDIENVLNKVETVVLEYALYDTKDAYKLQSMNMAMNDSERVKAVLSLQEYDALVESLRKHGAPEMFLKQLNTYRISMPYYLLLMLDGPCGETFEEYSFEPFFRNYCKKNKKNLITLLTTDEFINWQKSFPKYYWEENVRYLVKNENVANLLLKSEFELYKSSSTLQLRKLYQDVFYKSRYGSLIYEEHIRTLADKIERMENGGNELIVLDISNLVRNGENILKVLKERGFVISSL